MGDNLYYQVYGSFKASDFSVDESLIGGNKSAEDTDTSDNSSNIVVEPDAVAGSKLEEVDQIITGKKDFKAHMKKLAGRVIKYAKEEIDDAAKIDEIKKSLQAFVENILKEFEQYRFFATEDDGFDLKGSLILFKYVDKERLEVPGAKFYLYVFKYGLDEEKV